MLVKNTETHSTEDRRQCSILNNSNYGSNSNTDTSTTEMSSKAKIRASKKKGGDEELARQESSEDDEYESDPLVSGGASNNGKRAGRKVSFADLDRERQSGGTVVGSWFGLVLILGLGVVAMVVYWNQQKNNHQLANQTADVEGPRTPSRTRPPRVRVGDDDEDLDDDEVIANKEAANAKKGTFYFDPFAAVQTSNPLEMETQEVQEYYAQNLVPPVWNPLQDRDSGSNPDARLGYMIQPNTVNGTVAFVSEGDLYLSMFNAGSPDFEASIPSMKLTTTVGNVRNPKINPVYPYLIAYTATYTARRDIYLLDLRRRTHGSQPALRLTYWATSSGVRGLVGWKPDGKTLVFQALSNEVSLPDVRMYELTLAFEGDVKGDSHDPHRRNLQGDNAAEGQHGGDNEGGIQHPQVMQINPVPLSQALEGAYHDHEGCWYFTRFQQSSHTVRYQGGTAEAIWSWCDDHALAVDLTRHGFNGTSKAPSIFSMTTTNSATQQPQKYHYLLFLSDRGPNDDPNDSNEWKPTTMNLWAIPLPEKDVLNALANPTEQIRTNTPAFNPSQFVQLTRVSCEFGGMALQEYTLDPVTQNVVLRIGADLYWMSAESIQQKLEAAGPPSRRFLEENATEVAATTAAPIQESTDVPVQESTGAPVASTAIPHVEYNSEDIQKLGILVYSDFHEHQERLIALDFPDDLQTGDVFETAFGSLAFLVTARAQVWVAPVIDAKPTYGGAGENLPARRYRVLPGSKMGGAVRVLATRHVPLLLEEDTFSRRLALILATDPKSPAAEHAFYLIEVQSDAPPTFLSFDNLPKPFLGGHNGGGSVRDGGLGSVNSYSVTISPCGRRFAWTDTDGRICVMTLPLYKELESEYSDYTVLPKENELGEPLIGDEAQMKWSPGGRYLAVEHNARNQFSIISVVDCGDPLMPGSEVTGENADPKAAGIKLGRIVQVTPDRFNSFSPYWGKSPYDIDFYGKAATLAEAYNVDPETAVATTMLYFLTDRDIINRQSSPWGTRAPNVYFDKTSLIYGIPLLPQQHEHDSYSGHFPGGGAKELFAEKMLDLKSLLKKKDRSLTSAPSQAPTVDEPTETFPQDPDIDFGLVDLSFSRKAYRLAMIAQSTYRRILSQAKDDGSFLLVDVSGTKRTLKMASLSSFPSDNIDIKEVASDVEDYGQSTSRDHLFVSFDGIYTVIPNTAGGFLSLMTQDAKEPTNIAYLSDLAVSVWPSLEYQQMFGDAWRMMRDYFYDPEMTGIDWYEMYERYLPLVLRCAKREELDDALAQMASEVSALHVFVYDGEYSSPLKNDPVKPAHVPASFGAALQRSAEWKGYIITSLPEVDPDFSQQNGKEVYSPLSERTLRLSGQKGLSVGDVIVAINGESVMEAPDIHMLLRGLGHQSIRLDVLRLSATEEKENVTPEPVIAVPLKDTDDLLYSSWEYKTRQLAKKLAKEAGFTVGYAHLQSMSAKGDINSFYRGFFSDYDKEAMIIDVRHNRGGNIDWWLLDVLQRKAWMYWQGRATNATTGGLGWDNQFSFRGHLVVLVDEKTSSDGEGFSRGVSELGLGKLIGTRTWGGGIWLSSDNTLVDGGIATAPEIGTYNQNLGPGLGIEQTGVHPDIDVDNNPRTSYDGTDTQLEHAIEVLKDWLKTEPIVVPLAPEHKRNMALDESATCATKR